MPILKIADLFVDTAPIYERLTLQQQKYIVSNKDCTPDITIRLSEEIISKLQEENPHLTLSECEYIWSGSLLFNKILAFNAMMLHASAISYRDNAYLFSARSGTGKSTHTALWGKAFGEENITVINDDKPIIKRSNGVIKAFGSPFSGKTDLSANIGVPIRAICFLSRGEKNVVKKISPSDAIPLILDQTLRPRNQANMTKLLDTIEAVVNEVQIYVMSANMDTSAAIEAYNAFNV